MGPEWDNSVFHNWLSYQVAQNNATVIHPVTKQRPPSIRPLTDFWHNNFSTRQGKMEKWIEKGPICTVSIILYLGKRNSLYINLIMMKAAGSILSFTWQLAFHGCLPHLALHTPLSPYRPQLLLKATSEALSPFFCQNFKNDCVASAAFQPEATQLAGLKTASSCGFVKVFKFPLTQLIPGSDLLP